MEHTVGRTGLSLVVEAGRSSSLGFPCVERFVFLAGARSDESFASPTGVVHPVHLLDEGRRSVVREVGRGGGRLTPLQ